jgi:hypothetical protein
MKLMGHQFEDGNNRLGFAIGVVTGVIQFFLKIDVPTDFWSKLLGASITAGVCGFVGVMGKELFVIAKNNFLQYFRARKKTKK